MCFADVFNSIVVNNMNHTGMVMIFSGDMLLLWFDTTGIDMFAAVVQLRCALTLITLIKDKNRMKSLIITVW